LSIVLWGGGGILMCSGGGIYVGARGSLKKSESGSNVPGHFQVSVFGNVNHSGGGKEKPQGWPQPKNSMESGNASS